MADEYGFGCADGSCGAQTRATGAFGLRAKVRHLFGAKGPKGAVRLTQLSKRAG